MKLVSSAIGWHIDGYNITGLHPNMIPSVDKVTEALAEPAGPTRVLLVDDHISIRQMLAFLIPREGAYEIVGQVSSGDEAVESCRELHPRLVVIDLLLPGKKSGLDVVRELRRSGEEVRTLVYSGTTSPGLIAEAMRAGPDGFVHKEDTLQAFREALHAVTAGEQYFTPVIVESVERAGHTAVELLTDREREVLRLIAGGHSNKEMAERIGVAIKTIEYYRKNLQQKLKIHDVASLTRLAVKHGIVLAE
jgi:DNA-binding NarL/FixJ family response regulator